MLYNIVFTTDKTPPTHNVITTPWTDISSVIDCDNYFVLSYKLNDLPLTQKWIEQHFYIQRYYHTRCYDTNMYVGNTSDILQRKKELNNLLIKLDIKEEYCLTENLDPEHHLLNQLHYIFEKEVVKHKRGSQFRNWYEELNAAIHNIENLGNDNAAYFVIRTVIQPKNIRTYKPQWKIWPQLTLEDYKDFTTPQGGDLCLDFSTIGKDLFAAVITNDIELVKNKGLSQQTNFTDNTACCWENYFIEDADKKYYEWCDNNNVSDYYDISSPLYNPGRHILGKNVQDINTYHSFSKIIYNKYSKFVGRYISTDNYKEIIPYV